MWNLNYPNYCGSGLLGEQNIWLLQIGCRSSNDDDFSIEIYIFLTLPSSET